MNRHFLRSLIVVAIFNFLTGANADQDKPKITVKLMRYTLNSNGGKADSTSKVRFTVTTPDGKTLNFPKGKEKAAKEWEVKNGESVDLNEYVDVLPTFINNDRMFLKVQLYRDGKAVEPCEIQMENLSQFSRTVICRSDLNAQHKMGRTKEHTVDEAVEIYVRNESIENYPTQMVASKRGFKVE